MPPIRIGLLGRAHGLRGELALSDCPLSLAELRAIPEFTWKGKHAAERRLELAEAREVHDKFLVRFRGLEHRDLVRDLTLGELFVDAAELPDPGPGTAYAFQLIGLAVDTEDGRRLGVLESIVPTGANRVFIVQGEREWLIPATEDVLRRVDLERGVITVVLPPGLEEL